MNEEMLIQDAKTLIPYVREQKNDEVNRRFFDLDAFQSLISPASRRMAKSNASPVCAR